MKKKNQYKNSIAGARLKSLLDEKNVTRKEIIIEMNKQGFSTLTEQKLSDYINGRRPIPADLAIAISKHLDIKPEFLLVGDLIGNAIPINDPFTITPDDFMKSIRLDNAIMKSREEEEFLKSLGLNLLIFDTGEYEIYDDKFRMKLSQKQFQKVIKDTKKNAAEYVRSLYKAGDADD